ncbi:MAG: serine/threonine-protein kinase [Blastocatellia bacterium]
MISNVIGNYRILAKIGEGGMGEVFRGFDLMLEREVAIKALRPELARQPQVVERFRAEAVTLARLNHPHIATLHNFLRHNDDYLMVMEFVRGETLESVIQRHGALALGQSLRLFGQALEGIAQAHTLGVIHRDLKPSNLMLTETGAIKVMDFGIARVLGSARMTRTGRILGTIQYMSPEQVHGQEGDARSDLYSLGIVLYEMLTGRVPFSSQSEFELMRAQIEDPPPPPREFAEHIPEAIERIILRALAKNPAERFQTAEDFHAALTDSARALDLALNVSASDVTAMRAVGASGAPNALDALDALPETRLGAGALDNFGVSGAGDQFIKETRLGQMNSATRQTPTRLASLRQLTRQLGWKHYGAGAAAMVALIVAFSMFGSMFGGEKPAPSKEPSVSTPASSNVPFTPPITNPQPSIEPLGGAIGVQPLMGVGASGESRQPARAQSATRRKAPNPFPHGTAASGVAAARPTPPPAREPEGAVNRPNDERKDDERKSDERKKDKGSKWGRILGGAIEAIGGTKDVIKDIKERDDKQKDRDRKKN